MAITNADVQQPKGPLELKMFGGLTASELDARIDGWIVEGEGEVAAANIIASRADRAVRAWVLYRGYHSIYLRLLVVERDAAVEGDASRSFEQEQADGFKALADEQLGIFNGLIPAADAPLPDVAPSGTMRPTFVW